jgi:hypothetical protein
MHKQSSIDPDLGCCKSRGGSSSNLDQKRTKDIYNIFLIKSSQIKHPSYLYKSIDFITLKFDLFIYNKTSFDLPFIFIT